MIRLLCFVLVLPVLLGMAFLPDAVQDAQMSELTIFAAASLTEAFRAIASEFEARHLSTKIRFNFGGSQQLVQQIIQGARADVLASANVKQMKIAMTAGVIDTNLVRVFARNRLVVILPRNNSAHIRELRDIAKPNLKIVLADSGVPVGQYSMQFLDRCSQAKEYGAPFKKGVLKNVVSYEENVRAILSKVQLGECDAGIVYSSDLSQDRLREVRRIDFPDRLNVIAEYPIGIVHGTAELPLAKEFIEYVLSGEGRTVLSRFGFASGNYPEKR